MNVPTPEHFFDWALPVVRDLQRRYHLEGWTIGLRVVPDDTLRPRNAAEVSLREEYRAATIYLSKSLVLEADAETLAGVLEHELQHVALHPLDALRSLMLDLVPEAMRGVVLSEFGRANERVRATLERALLEARAEALERASDTHPVVRVAA